MQDADAAAAAAMRATEGAVKAEMEAKAVYEQVKLAVSAAQASMESLMEEEAELSEAEAAAVEKAASEGEGKGKVCLLGAGSMHQLSSQWQATAVPVNSGFRLPMQLRVGIQLGLGLFRLFTAGFCLGSQRIYCVRVDVLGGVRPCAV